MPGLSEFIAFVATKSGIKKSRLVEQEILIHRILREIYSSPHFIENYLFKGGSCLVKCYFGYYRFSVDLDFTWGNQEVWTSKWLDEEINSRALDALAVISGGIETANPPPPEEKKGEFWPAIRQKMKETAEQLYLQEHPNDETAPSIRQLRQQRCLQKAKTIALREAHQEMKSR